jgi:hypothetical protein
MKTTEDV